MIDPIKDSQASTSILLMIHDFRWEEA